MSLRRRGSVVHSLMSIKELMEPESDFMRLIDRALKDFWTILEAFGGQDEVTA